MSVQASSASEATAAETTDDATSQIAISRLPTGAPVCCDIVDEPAPARTESVAPAKASNESVSARSIVAAKSAVVSETSVDDDATDSSFFSKSTEEVHIEHLRLEAPDLHEELVSAARPRRTVHPRARSIVLAVVGLAAMIGGTAMVRRVAAGNTRQNEVAAAVANAPAPPPPAEREVAPPPPAKVEAPPALAESAPAVAEIAPAAEARLADESTATARAVEAAPTAAAATTTTAAPVATTIPAPEAKPAVAAATDDADAKLSGAALLGKARDAMARNDVGHAASFAQKAANKGAGGSAFYILGAAYQQMGSPVAAKQAYGTCAKSGCAEAAECTALVDQL